MTRNKYTYAPTERELRTTVLNTVHRGLGAKLVPFAGWEMPVQYEAGIFAEHIAVRTAAGLFDVSHMGVFEITGPGAAAFLNALASNDAASLQPGRSRYTGFHYPDGSLIDDAFIYRIDETAYLLVVNAANADEVRAWLNAAQSNEYILDPESPDRDIPDNVSLRDLRDAGTDSLVELALQGPESLNALKSLADDASAATLESLVFGAHAPAILASIPVGVARTGYAGERVGYELFVHPERAVELWNKLCDLPSVQPCGLGARDSLRVEAGLPLFGHELAGEFSIAMSEAGYPWAVKLQKDFFVGQAALKNSGAPARHIIRLKGEGAKSLRAGHLILDSDNCAVGAATSFAFLDAAKNFIVLALVDNAFDPRPGEAVSGYRASEPDSGAEPDDRKLVNLTALARFPDAEERAAWPDQYGDK